MSADISIGNLLLPNIGIDPCSVGRALGVSLVALVCPPGGAYEQPRAQYIPGDVQHRHQSDPEL